MIISTILRPSYDTNVKFVFAVNSKKSLFGNDPRVIFFQSVSGGTGYKRHKTPRAIYINKLLTDF